MFHSKNVPIVRDRWLLLENLRQTHQLKKDSMQAMRSACRRLSEQATERKENPCPRSRVSPETADIVAELFFSVERS